MKIILGTPVGDDATIRVGEEKKPKFERVTSSIAFPYSDIGDAIAVAEGLLKGGGLPLTRDQLAAAMGQAPNGGGFSTKISTAKLFGVMEANAGKYQLTELGFEIVDQNRQKEAMVKAFLNVELYRKVYDEFRGKRLPPRPHGLENALISLGVSPKQVTNARLYLDRSARKAGFFPNGDEDRLVEPILGPSASASAPTDTGQSSDVPVESYQTRQTRPEASDLHASIVGWLEELPPPLAKWSKVDQADWLQALATMFRVIYKSDEKGAIQVIFKPAEPSA